MLFESRRILLGFRIKLNFDPSLEKRNSYIFINLSKTPTIKDLLSSIKERFEISQNIDILLNDCPLLYSEDSSVLVDANEIRLVPGRIESKDISVEASSKCSALDNLMSTDRIEVSKDKKSPACVEITAGHEKLSVSQNCRAPSVKENSNHKSKRFYSSIADTIRYLNQSHRNELDTASVLSNEPFTSKYEEHDENKLNYEKDEKSIYNSKESCNEGNYSVEVNGDEVVEKRKRKRKRKHSKKPKLESGYSKTIHIDQCLDSYVETSANNLTNDCSRQHIFFQGGDDENTEGEDHEKEYQSFFNNLSVHPGKMTSVEANVDDTNVITDVTDNGYFSSKKNESKGDRQLISDPLIEPRISTFKPCLEPGPKIVSVRENFHPKSAKFELVDSSLETNEKEQILCNQMNEFQLKQPSSNGFFSMLNSNESDSRNSRTKQISNENVNSLATLLMCKQLQSPIEYSLQFKHKADMSRSYSNSSSVSSHESKDHHSVHNPISDVSIGEDSRKILISNVNDECKTLCQYKIVGDRVLFCEPNGMWNIISDKEVSKLQLIDEPHENQKILFQVLYLSPELCPSMSDLVYGKVISFHKNSNKLVLNILPAFIDNLMKCCGENDCLPDEFVHIAENLYEISWTAVKNPRLLM